MASLTFTQLVTYAQAAGLPSDKAKVAAAIALAESSGNTTAHNAVPPDDSYGLWQINMLGSLGPSRRAAWGLKSNDQLYDPATNAKAMASLSRKGTSFGAWTTYTRGTYKKYLNGSADVATDDSASAIASSGSVDTGSSVLGLASVFESGFHYLTAAANWLSDQGNWVRVGKVLAGSAMLVGGLVIVVGPKAADVAGNVAGGVAGKVVGKVAGKVLSSE